MPKNKKQNRSAVTRSKQQQQQRLSVRKTKSSAQRNKREEQEHVAKKQRVEDAEYVETSESESESESSSSSAESASSHDVSTSKGPSLFTPLCATNTSYSSTEGEAREKPTFRADEHRELVKELRDNLAPFFTPCHVKPGHKSWCQPIRFELVVKDAGKLTELVEVRIFGNYAMKSTFQLRGRFEDRARHPEAKKGNWLPYPESECVDWEKHFVAEIDDAESKAVLLSVIVSLTVFSQHLVLCQEGLVEFLQNSQRRAEEVQSNNWVVPRVEGYISEVEKFLLKARGNQASDVQEYIKMRARIARYMMTVVQGSADADDLRKAAEVSTRSFYKKVNAGDVMTTDKFGSRFALGHSSLHFFQVNKKNKLAKIYDA